MIAYLKKRKGTDEVVGHQGFVDAATSLPHPQSGEEWIRCPGPNPNQYTIVGGKIVKKEMSRWGPNDHRHKHQRMSV